MTTQDPPPPASGGGAPPPKPAAWKPPKPPKPGEESADTASAPAAPKTESAAAAAAPTTKATSRGLPPLLLVIGLVILFIGRRVLGDSDIGTFVAVAGAGAILAAVAIRATNMAGATGNVRVTETRLLYGYAAVIVSLVVYALSTDSGLDMLGLTAETRDKWDSILTVLWITGLTVSVTATLFMELAYFRMPVAAAVELRRIRTAAQSGLSLALALVFVFAINYVANKRDIKKDLSYFKTTHPSETSLALVRRLETPVHAILFFPRVHEVLDQVEPYFDELARASRGKLHVEVRDHALDPELARQLRVSGNGFAVLVKGDPSHPAPTKTKTRSPHEPDAANLPSERIEIGTEFETARTRLRTLDGRFQQSFTKLTRPPRSLHITAGHAERSTSGEENDPPGMHLEGVQELLRRFNVETHRLGMAQGLANRVPDNARAVALIGPREPLLPEEVRALGEYVKNGGRLLVMFDPKENAGLDPLLGQLGLRALPGVLCSQRNSIPRTFSPADKARVFSNAYSAHPIVTTSSRHSNEVATVFVEGGALTRLEGRVLSPAPQITFPLRTTNEFWRDLDGDYEKDSNEPLEEMNMIAAITLRRGQGEEGRVVVIADGDFVTDQVIRNPGNMLVFVDSLRWLIGEEEISGDLSSEEDVAIEHTREEDKIWFYATSFAVPVPLLALGLWVAQRRRRRRAPTSTSGPKTPSAAPPAAAPPKSEPPAEGGKP